MAGHKALFVDAAKTLPTGLKEAMDTAEQAQETAHTLDEMRVAIRSKSGGVLE